MGEKQQIHCSITRVNKILIFLGVSLQKTFGKRPHSACRKYIVLYTETRDGLEESLERGRGAMERMGNEN